MRYSIGCHPLSSKLVHDIEVGNLLLGFQRTCRVPVSEREYGLPAGLGSFPVYRVADFRSGTPKEWRDEGLFIPMYRQEAMWVNFDRYHTKPVALIVAAGNINAVSGKPFDPSKVQGSEEASGFDIKLETPQNYLVIPPQPWLDGWKSGEGHVYQFVAAEMGSGETIEGQITGEETVGGIQFVVYKPNKDLIVESRPREYIESGSLGSLVPIPTLGGGSGVREMGLGRGGKIRQKIYPDTYGLDVWDKSPVATTVIYLVSSEDFRQVAGYEAPETPIDYKTYQEYGLPWFELHDTKLGDSKGSDGFGKSTPVSGGTPKQMQDEGKCDKDPFEKFKPMK